MSRTCRTETLNCTCEGVAIQKLTSSTRLLQPSLSGDALISVICTVSPSALNLAESLSTLSFAQGLKRVTLKAQRKEVVDPQALIQQYQNEIAELRALLREKEVGGAQDFGVSTSRSEVSDPVCGAAVLTAANEKRGDGKTTERAEEFDFDLCQCQ
jgi:hypothetical protein